MNRLLREHLGHMGHVSLDLVQIELEIESVLDAIRFRLFLKSPDYKYVPYDIRKKRTSSRFATTPWRNATPNSRVFIQVSVILP